MPTEGEIEKWCEPVRREATEFARYVLAGESLRGLVDLDNRVIALALAFGEVQKRVAALEKAEVLVLELANENVYCCGEGSVSCCAFCGTVDWRMCKPTCLKMRAEAYRDEHKAAVEGAGGA